LLGQRINHRIVKHSHNFTVIKQSSNSSPYPWTVDYINIYIYTCIAVLRPPTKRSIHPDSAFFYLGFINSNLVFFNLNFILKITLIADRSTEGVIRIAGNLFVFFKYLRIEANLSILLRIGVAREVVV